jgi:cell division protein FtsW
MLIVAGIPFRHVAIIVLIAAMGLGLIVTQREYLQNRIRAFIDRDSYSQTFSYQSRQSVMAIGAGEIFGRGFGKSIQKFGSLPEPVGDSIFAVAAEEFGFAGSMALIVLYLLFAISAFRISVHAPDVFSGLTVIGIAILITAESFMNMASMLGILPVAGMPLLFVSQGGTALIVALAGAGIIANISKYAR